MWRVIARTKLDEPSADVMKDFPTRPEAAAFLTSLGFSQYEDHGGVSYWHHPADDVRRPDKKVNLAGYIIDMGAEAPRG